MDLLVCLARQDGATLLREHALDTVWPDVVVEASAVTHCISEIRSVFDDSAREQRVIKTFAKRGYALLPPVRFGVRGQEADEGLAVDELAPEQLTASRFGRLFPAVLLVVLFACSLLLTFLF